MNGDKKFADCSVPQELDNDQIDELMGAQARHARRLPAFPLPHAPPHRVVPPAGACCAQRRESPHANTQRQSSCNCCDVSWSASRQLATLTTQRCAG